MPSDLAILALNVGILAGVFGLGFALSGRLALDARRRGMSPWQRALVWLVASPPLLSLLFYGEVDVGIVDGSVAAIAAFVGLWIGTHVLLATVFDVEPTARTGC